MSSYEDSKPVERCTLIPGEHVACDGRIYQDEHGQLWFGVLHLLESQADFRRLWKEIDRIEKQKEIDEDAS